MPDRRGLIEQFLRFAVVGVAGFIVNAGIVEWLAPGSGPYWAQVVAFPAAVSATWWLNRRFTFAASGLPAHHEWLRYVLSNLLGWVANNGVYYGLVLGSPLAYEHPALAVAAGSLAGMFLNFAGSRWLVFNNTPACK